MTFTLANYSQSGNFGFDEDSNFYGKYHITTKIDECPFEGKFQQVDYDVKIIIPDIAPSQIAQQLPIILQNWINETYIIK